MLLSFSYFMRLLFRFVLSIFQIKNEKPNQKHVRRSAMDFLSDALFRM